MKKTEGANSQKSKAVVLTFSNANCQTNNNSNTRNTASDKGKDDSALNTYLNHANRLGW